MTLPVTVLSVDVASAGLWAVRVAMADGRELTYLVPDSLATLEGVRISALVMATLSDVPVSQVSTPGGRHRRYDQRTAT